jgi:bifunctional DNA-binding transcriptional regulator/antitoxin component of YhaV-PrlF toxin-antitoxin module
VVYCRGGEEYKMVVVRVGEDGAIQLPAALRERFGIQPGAQIALDEGDEDGSLQLRVLPAEAQLTEEEGVWTILSHFTHPEGNDADWLARVRDERDASLRRDR